MTDKQQYVSEVQEKFSEWDRRIEEIIRKAEASEKESELVKDLLEKQKEAKSEFEQLRQSDEGRFEDAKGRVGVATQALQDVLVRTSEQFQLESPRASTAPDKRSGSGGQGGPASGSSGTGNVGSRSQAGASSGSNSKQIGGGGSGPESTSTRGATGAQTGQMGNRGTRPGGQMQGSGPEGTTKYTPGSGTVPPAPQSDAASGKGTNQGGFPSGDISGTTGKGGQKEAGRPSMYSQERGGDERSDANALDASKKAQKRGGDVNEEEGGSA